LVITFQGTLAINPTSLVTASKTYSGHVTCGTVDYRINHVHLCDNFTAWADIRRFMLHLPTYNWFQKFVALHILQLMLSAWCDIQCMSKKNRVQYQQFMVRNIDINIFI